MYKPAWENMNVSEVLFFQVKMKDPEARIILTNKHDDFVRCCAEVIAVSNVSLFLWFHKHCMLNLGQMPTDIFEDSISLSEYSPIWRE